MPDNDSRPDAPESTVSARRFAGNAASVSLATGSKAIVYFVVALVVTRVLGTESLGAFTVALSSALLALRVAELGVGAIVVRDTARDPSRGAELLGSSFLIRIPGLALMALTVAVITRLVGYQGDEQALMWLLGGYVALDSLSRLFFSNAHGRMRMEEEAWITVPVSLLIGIGSVGVLLAGEGLVAVGTIFIIGGGLQFLGAAVLVSGKARHWVRAASPATAMRILRESWPIGLAGLAAVVYYRVDTLMLAALAGDGPTGEYSMAYNLLYGPNLLMWALMASAFPILSGGAERGGHSLQRTYRRLTGAAVAAGLLLLVAIPIASFVLLILYGTAPENAVLSLQILLVAQLFTFVSAATSTTFNATDAQRINLRIVGVGVVLNIALNALVIPLYEAPGAAVTTLATELFVALTGVIVLWRRGLRPLPTRADDGRSTVDTIFITSFPDDPDGPITGPQRVMRNLIGGLSDQTHRMEVWSSPYRSPPRDRRTIRDGEVEVRFVGPFRITAVALTHPGAVLHIGSFSLYHVAPLMARRILGWLRPIGPIMYTAHGVLSVEARMGYRVVPLVTTLAERILLNGSDRVIVISDQMADLLRSKYRVTSPQLVVIPPAAPLEFVPPDSVHADRQPLAPRFLYAGELRQVKGLDVLAAAAVRLHRSAPDRPWSILVAGAPQSTWHQPVGWDELTQANRLEQVDFVSTEELNRLYASATALVLPSVYEPYGMVVLEAMASGTPAIVSDRVGAREIIEPGLSGLVFPSGDSDALYEAMGWVLDNPQAMDAMNRAAVIAASSRTLDFVAARHVEIYGGTS